MLVVTKEDQMKVTKFQEKGQDDGSWYLNFPIPLKDLEAANALEDLQKAFDGATKNMVDKIPVSKIDLQISRPT